MYDLNTPLKSAGSMTAADIQAAFSSRNGDTPDGIGEAVHAEATATGINQDFLAGEIGVETGWWTSEFATERNNPSGLGAVDSAPGQALWFDSIRAGVRATVAHWLTYIEGEGNPLAGDDPRYEPVLSTGRAGTIRTLGQIGNGVWATAPNYATAVRDAMNAISDGPGQGGDDTMGGIPKPEMEYRHTDSNLWYNYGGRDRYPLRAICYHVADGTYEGSISWAANPASNASFNFIVGRDGRIAEVVDPFGPHAPWANAAINPDLPPGLADLADGEPNANWVTASIEHEGHPFDEDFPTEAQLESSARLSAWLCSEAGLIPSETTITRHTNYDRISRPNCPGPRFDIAAHRQRIANLLTGAAPPKPETSFFFPGQANVREFDPHTGDRVGVAGGFKRVVASTPYFFQVFGYPLLNEHRYDIWRHDADRATEKPERVNVVCQEMERGTLEYTPGDDPARTGWDVTVLPQNLVAVFRAA